MNGDAPLDLRATFLARLSWESVVQLNKALCSRSAGVAHGFNRETVEGVRKQWEAARRTSMTILELLDFLRLCHKNSPFLNFNGNVFGEFARQLLATGMLGMPVVRVEAASSLAAHYVAGVLDREPARDGISTLLEVGLLQPGDRVTTLKFSRQGTVTRVVPDGRVAWRPDGRKTELLANPESLVKIEPGKKIPRLVD